MEQELYAFWKYDQYPYTLYGKIEEFKGDRVYIKSYQSWFKPFKVVEGKDALRLISDLDSITYRRTCEINDINLKYKKELDSLIKN